MSINKILKLLLALFALYAILIKNADILFFIFNWTMYYIVICELVKTVKEGIWNSIKSEIKVVTFLFLTIINLILVFYYLRYSVIQQNLIHVTTVIITMVTIFSEIRTKEIEVRDIYNGFINNLCRLT